MGDEADEGMSWWTILKIAGIVLLVVALLAVLPLLAEVVAREGEVPPWLGPAGIGLGVVAFYLGFRAYRKRQLVRDTPTSKIRSLAIGTAEVQGEAQPLAEPLVSPLTHTPACMYQFKVREKQTVRKQRTDPQTGRTRTETEEEWRTVLQLEEEVPFCVDDGTGRVPVEPDGAELLFEVEKEAEADEHEAPPAALRTWYEEHDTREPFDPSAFLPDPLAEKAEAIQAGEMDPAEMNPEDFHPEGFDPEEGPPADLDAQDVFLGSLISDGEPGSSRTKAAAGPPGQEGSGGLLGPMKTVLGSGKEMLEEMQGSSGKRKYMTQATSNERRFEERVLGVGESTYVFGSAQRLPEADGIRNAENLVLRGDPSTGQFIVSDKSPDRILNDKLVRAVMGIGAALVLIPYGVVALLLWAGVL